MKKSAYETWVTSFVKNVAEYFDLAGWTLGVEFSEEEDKIGTYAENNINTSYMQSTIVFYKPARLDFESGKMDHLITAVVHELVHIFLDPFQDYMNPHLSITTTPLFMNALENQTQRLTMVFLKNLPENLIPPRPVNGKHNPASKNHKSKPANDPVVSADPVGKHGK